jgi:hypothetical protein
MDFKNAKYFADKIFTDTTTPDRPYKKREDFLAKYRTEK